MFRLLAGCIAAECNTFLFYIHDECIVHSFVLYFSAHLLHAQTLSPFMVKIVVQTLLCVFGIRHNVY